ncbi:zf-HC2 domain-containing protein [Pannus brasiliensis CCIBt3594]|uniref:Zf-HC2 domain-containing protein n=1 Tax=Pannus brasiliensis CCIBt3594 TaxID=1427578 RepID=A0AAW9QX18_9CHRO
MNNYQPEDARWDRPRDRHDFDDPLDESADFFCFEDEERARQFDLISAYIDGEVTPEERHEVQRWLDTDPDAKKLYLQLRGIQTHLQQIPVPVSASADRLAERVFQKVDRGRKRRAFLFGGAIFAAMAVAVVSHGLFGREVQHANRESDSLMIALNQPIVEIPIAEETTREQ